MVNPKEFYDALAKSHPKLSAGRVYCHACGTSQKVDSATCIRTGWPKCCGSTMSLDTPEERRPSPSSEGRG